MKTRISVPVRPRHRKTAILLCVCLYFLLLMPLLCGCGKMSAEDVRLIAEPLIEASLPLNGILYGEGLALTEESYGNYRKVADGEAYTDMADLKKALSDVFTAEYCERMNETVLGGYSGEDGVYYARYIGVDGRLYGMPDAKVYLTETRQYRYDTIEVKSSSDKRILFSVETTAGGDTQRVNVKLLYDDAAGKWLLDTPTY